MLNETNKWKGQHKLPKLTENDKETILVGAGAANRNERKKKRSSRQVPNALFINTGHTVPKHDFKRVELAHPCSYDPRTHALLAFFKKTQGLKLSGDEKRLAFFLIDEKKKYAFWNGAVLFKRKLLPPKNFRRNLKLTPTDSSQEMFLWNCTFASPFSRQPLKNMRRSESIATLLFYEGLYKQLAAFGQERNIPCLWVVLNPQEALCLNALGSFPFIFKTNPQENKDGLFRGLVALHPDISKVRAALQEGAAGLEDR